MDELTQQSAPQPAVNRTAHFSRQAGEEAHRLHVLQQDDGSKDGEHE